MHEVKPYRRAHPHSRLLAFEGVLYLAFIVFLFLVLGFATDASTGAVLHAFLPALVFGILVLAAIQTDNFHPAYNWLILVAVLVAAGLVFFLVETPVVQGLDHLMVLVMNAILMSIALLVFHASYSHEPRVHEHELDEYRAHGEKPAAAEPKRTPPPAPVVVERTVVQHVHHEAESEVEAVVHSIEDKAKALNFVIGRVYSVYHGGTERLRNKIRIDKAWYQEFNQIDAKDSARRRAQAIVLLGKIKDRLDLLEKSEREIFGDDVSKLRNIQHAVDGTDTIVDVLVRNDKDPARQYYDGARKFCEEGIAKLTQGKPLDSVVPTDSPAPKEMKGDKEGMKRGVLGSISNRS